MILREFTPGGILQEFVQRFRVIHFEFASPQAVTSKIYIPRPECILHFTLRDSWSISAQGKNDVQPAVVFRGQCTSTLQQCTNQSFLGAQIIFHPASVFRLIGIPASELANQHIDAQCLFSADVLHCLDQLQHALTYADMIPILEAFVLKVVKNCNDRGLAIDRVSRQMIYDQNKLDMDDLADQSCMSVRNFRRRFSECVGVNPMTYAKIIRLNRAYNLKNAYPDLDWLSIAVDSNYFDYQHMVKDFKLFTDHTPIELNKLEKRAPERLLGLSKQLYLDRV
jgi:AraC-like DNA-binding protein